ncbi:hypothetical protein Dsin_014014 [Dipteronia sinensis]|uniref:Membrane-associated kinase regulator 2 n=1 Tax=Dipteronia sinensis TaxID=43782 RepID=A0AAE0E9M9_9ROSI|nr:hypothetical protein Dsin_014014 [Dipteronia sinensis]
MEALSFLKFWSPTTNISHKENIICNNNNGNNCGGGGGGGSEIPSLVVESDCCCDDDEDGDDSFFELELTVSDFDKKKNTSTSTTTNNININNNSSDVLSKRKILPIEPTTSKPPQSPIALLKSAPKLRVSIFKKSKSSPSSSMAATTEKTEKTNSQKNEKKLFTVKFKFEQEGSTTNTNNNNLSMFNRVCSLRKTQPPQQQQQHSHGLRDDNESVQSYDSSSKRFSKDVIQKYLKLIRPLYVKVSKKNDTNNKMMISRLSGEFSEASPAASPATAIPMQSPKQSNNITAGFRVVSRHLGKSKSSSSTSAAVMSPARRDDSLLLQHDGIQSAILHCKKSFNSSRDSSSLSRSTSTSSQETFSNLSSKDSSLLSRFSSDSLSEESISAIKSNESGNGLLEFKRERALFVHEN